MRDRCKSVRGNYRWSEFGKNVSQNGCKATVEKKI